MFFSVAFFALKHRLCQHVPTIYVLSISKKNITIFHLKKCHFTYLKIAEYCIDMIFTKGIQFEIFFDRSKECIKLVTYACKIAFYLIKFLVVIILRF